MGASDAFFELVVDALVGFLPDELAGFHHRVGWNGVKVWYGSEHREHYECQYLARPDGAPGPHPGLLLEWRSVGEGMWEALVAYAVQDGHTVTLVQQWLSAGLVSPAPSAGKP